MKEHETFKMTYSAQQQAEIDNIRKKYLPREESKLEQLRALDRRVNRKASVCSIALGLIGTLLAGFGMSLILSDLGALFGHAALPLGIGLGIAGMLILACAYPLYHRILKKEREKAAPEILRLSEELMQ